MQSSADWGVIYQAQKPRSGFLGIDLEQHMAHLADVYVANRIKNRKTKTRGFSATALLRYEAYLIFEHRAKQLEVISHSKLITREGLHQRRG